MICCILHSPPQGQKKARGASTPISAIPRIGNQIDIFVGEPFSVEPWIERVKALGAQGVTWENDAAYKEIQEDLTNHLRERLLEVEAQARPYLYGGSGKGKKARKGRK
uniref:Tafazzin family protein n=1 Tax=Heterosigma akashiwo TaxID=2829 RepID=A0A6V1P9Z0_HETAK